jgi:hypothetical protein
MIDLGTGDGAAVLDAARRSPATLCVGLDADASRMREASARAARSARRGGLANALFLASDATAIPAAFHARADEIAITLPWGSLLRTILAGDRRFAAEVAGALAPGGRVRILVSIEDRDRLGIGAHDADASATDDLGAFAVALQSVGLDIVERREATADDVAAIRSSWARRLGIPARRSARLLVAARGSAAERAGDRRRDPADERLVGAVGRQLLERKLDDPRAGLSSERGRDLRRGADLGEEDGDAG